jgi:hypothetical protein
MSLRRGTVGIPIVNHSISCTPDNGSRIISNRGSSFSQASKPSIKVLAHIVGKRHRCTDPREGKEHPLSLETHTLKHYGNSNRSLSLVSARDLIEKDLYDICGVWIYQVHFWSRPLTPLLSADPAP